MYARVHLSGKKAFEEFKESSPKEENRDTEVINGKNEKENETNSDTATPNKLFQQATP